MRMLKLALGERQPCRNGQQRNAANNASKAHDYFRKRSVLPPIATGHDTLMVSVASIVVPSSSTQVNLSVPDSSGLNLNWKYGLAETALSGSQPNTNFPFNSQVNLLMIMRGIGLPFLVRLRFVTEEQVIVALGTQLGLKVLPDLKPDEVDPLPMRTRRVRARAVTITCRWCQQLVTLAQFPGPAPRYCGAACPEFIIRVV
jgi:hypothetical protein